MYELGVPLGYWEAKDEDDDLDEEIEKKFRKGYPQDNIIFEDSHKAVLIQDKQAVMRCGVEKKPICSLLVLVSECTIMAIMAGNFLTFSTGGQRLSDYDILKARIGKAGADRAVAYGFIDPPEATSEHQEQLPLLQPEDPGCSITEEEAV